MNSVLKLLLEGEALDTAQIGKILGLGADAVERELADLRRQGVLLGWRRWSFELLPCEQSMTRRLRSPALRTRSAASVTNSAP